jgi:hypothetical protein
VADETLNDDKTSSPDGAVNDNDLSPEDADLLRRKAIWAGAPSHLSMPFRQHDLTPQQRKALADSLRRLRRKVRAGDPNLRK